MANRYLYLEEGVGYDQLIALVGIGGTDVVNHTSKSSPTSPSMGDNYHPQVYWPPTLWYLDDVLMYDEKFSYT